jgi:hypothetical protein
VKDPNGCLITHHTREGIFVRTELEQVGGYELLAAGHSLTISATDSNGLYSATRTIRELLQEGTRIPALKIQDWPTCKDHIDRTAKRVLDLPTGDVVTVQFKFQSGATGFIGAISSTPYYGRFTVFGDQMWVEARDDSHPQHGGKTHLITCRKDGVQHSQTFPAKDPVKANLEEWADAVTNGTPYRFQDEQRIGNVAVLEAIAKSVQSGVWETV